MKTNITRIAALSVCMTMLASCGNVAAPNETESSIATSLSEEELISSGEADLETSSPDSAESQADERVLALIKAHNSMGEYITSPIPYADALYNDVLGLLDDELTVDGFFDPDTLTVGFKKGDEKYTLSYCGEDVFAWKHKGGTAYYDLDSESAQQLRSRMAAYAALGIVLDGAQYSIDTTPAESSFLKDLAEAVEGEFAEERRYYVSDDTDRLYTISVSGSSVYYSQYPDPYYITDVDFYEYFANDTNSYCRTEDSVVYYEADIFQGELEMQSLPSQIADGYDYRESFLVNADGAYTVEIYDSDDNTAYLLFDGVGDLCAEWSLNDNGITVISDYTIAAQAVDFDALFDHAAENSAQKFNKTENDTPLTDDNWFAYDTEKYGLLDLSGEIVEGKEIDDPGVVRSWREYVSGGGNYTVESRTAGAGRTEYRLCTFDGTNYFYHGDLDIHDSEPNLSSEEILIGDKLYQSVFYPDEYDSREFTAYPLSMYGEDGVRCPIDLILMGDEEAEQVRAYEVTIDGEPYICEEWDMHLDQIYKVYIKDGQIVGYLGAFLRKPVVHTFTRLEKAADTSLIKAPESFKDYHWND